MHVEDVRVLLVELGERADAVGAQELVLVEHLREDPAKPLRVDQGQDPPLGHAQMSRARGVDGLHQFGHPPHALQKLSHARGTRSRCHASITVVAHRGSRPTIERTLSRLALPSGSRSRS